MKTITNLYGNTFKTTVYESPVGKVEIENEFLVDGSISTTLWLIYPDGFGEEIFSLEDAKDKLEL